MQNQVSRSNSSTGWTTSAASVSNDVAVLTPTGNGTVRVVEDGTTAVHIAIPPCASLVTGKIYTAQALVKKQSSARSYFVVAHSGGAGQCWFDFATGMRGSLNASIIAAGMESVGSGWYLCWITYIASNTQGPRFYPATADGSGTSFAGDGVSYYLVGDVHNTSTAGPVVDAVVTTGTSILERTPRSGLGQGDNYFLQSENLATSWTGVAASAGTGADFDGNTTNCALVEDGTNAGHYFTQTPNAGAAKDKIMTVMCLAKAGTRNYLCIAPAGAGVQVTFDLTTGAATFNQGSGVNAGHRLGHGAIPLKNGWFLCYVIFRQDTAATPVRFYAGNSTTGAAAYTGTNGNKAIYITRMQLSFSNGPGRYTKTTTVAILGRAPRGHAIQNLVAPYINDTSWAWTGVQAITADPTPTPWGTTAYRLVENTANSAHAVQSSGSTFVQGRIQSMRVRLKAGTRSWAIVGIGGGGIAAWINLSTGAFGTTNGFIEKDIKSLGSGWYEVTLSAASPNAGGPTVYATSGDGVAVYTGDGSSYILAAEVHCAETRAAASQPITRHQGRAPRSLMRPWNLCKSSQNIHGDTTNWVSIGSVVRAASAFNAPDGSATASNISDTSNAEYRGVYQAVAVPKDRRSYCLSVYVRGGTTSPVFGINYQLGGGTTQAMSLRIDPNTGQYSTSGEPFRTYVEKVKGKAGETWWRLTLVIRNNCTNNTAQFSFYAATSTSIGAGDTVAGQGNVDLWGVMFHEGEGAMEYIATDTTSKALPGMPQRKIGEVEHLLSSNDLNGFGGTGLLAFTSDAVAPGGSTSYRLREDSTAASAHVAQATIQTLRKGRVVFMSCIAKVGSGRTWLALGGNSGNSTSWFDIQNGVLGNVGALLLGNPIIRPRGNGWYFVGQAFILDVTTPLVNFYLSSGNGIAVYNGDGASYMLIAEPRVTYSNGPPGSVSRYPFAQAITQARAPRGLLL